MFHAVKGCMKLRTGGDHHAVYLPCRYLRRLIVAWMCHNRCVVWSHKKVSLMSKYGVEDGDVVPNPISFKDYLRKLLKRGFWGEDVVLYALSVIYDIRITVLNACTLDEYRYRHSKPIAEADMVLIFTGSNHYLYAGKCIGRYYYILWTLVQGVSTGFGRLYFVLLSDLNWTFLH